MIKKSTRNKIALGSAMLIIGYAIYSYINIQLHLREKEEACFTQLAETLSSGLSPDELFQADFYLLQSLVEYSLVARSQMLEVSGRLRVNVDKPLSSADLLILKQGTEDYLDIREDLYDIANGYSCALEVEESTLLEYGISPELRLKGMMLSLGAALTLYDMAKAVEKGMHIQNIRLVSKSGGKSGALVLEEES